jgi:hypothetical protein
MSEEKTHHFEAWGYSDDCAGISGADCESEYDCGGEWFELLVNGVVVGKCRMQYADRNWTFEAESSVDISAGKKLEE